MKLSYTSRRLLIVLKTVLKLYCSFKVTEKQRQEMIDEKEKQRQIEIQRYKHTVIVLIVKSFIHVVHHFICKKNNVTKPSYVF